MRPGSSRVRLLIDVTDEDDAVDVVDVEAVRPLLHGKTQNISNRTESTSDSTNIQPIRCTCPSIINLIDQSIEKKSTSGLGRIS